MMTSEKSRSERNLWVRLPEHYPQFFYHDLIYIHTTNIFILISFFKADGDAGPAPTNGSRTSNSRGNSGIFGRPGHRSQRRIPLQAVMPACNDPQIVGEIVYIYICVCEWSYEKFDDIYICIMCTVCSSVKYVSNEKELNGKHKIKR